MRVITDRAAFRKAAAAAPPDARVPVELRVDVADPFEAYRRARSGDGNDVFLETTGGQSGWDYFTTDAVERVTVSADAVSRGDGSPSLDALARVLDDERDVLTGVRHRRKPHVSVQFHPESILTDVGERMIGRFCQRCSTT